jgi:hypothetical protein
MAAYSDMRVALVDAAVLAVVERLREPKLATLDRRHFNVMRPRHVEALELLPQQRSRARTRQTEVTSRADREPDRGLVARPSSSVRPV